MSDPSVDQSIPEQCAVDADLNSPNSPPAHEASGSEKEENEMSHSEPATGDSMVPTTEQINLTEMNDCNSAEDHVEENNSGKSTPPDPTGIVDIKDPVATQTNVHVTVPNDSVHFVEEIGLHSISPDDYEKDVNTQGQSSNLSSGIEDSAQIENVKFDDRVNKDAAYCENTLAEESFPADGMHPASSDTDRSVHDDSEHVELSTTPKENDVSLTGEAEPSEISEQQKSMESTSTDEATVSREEVPENEDVHPASSDTDRSALDDSEHVDLSTTPKENDVSLTGEAEPSEIIEQQNVADSTLTGEATVSKDEVPENEEFPFVQGEKVSPITEINVDEDLSESSMLRNEEHSDISPSISVATSEQTATAPGLQDQMGTKSREAVDTSEAVDHKLLTERSENGFGGNLSDEQRSNKFPCETAMTAEAINHQEAEQDTDLKDADQLSVDNESPPTISLNELMGGASSEKDSLDSSSDMLNIENLPASLGTAGETADILTPQNHTSIEPSEQLSYSNDGDVSQVTSEEGDETLPTDAGEDGGTSEVNANGVTTPKVSSIYSDSETSVENTQHAEVSETPSYHEKTEETESLMQPERVVEPGERENEVLVTEAYLTKSASEMKTEPDSFSEEQLDNEASFNTSPIQGYSQTQQLPPLDSDSLLEHFATEHHVAGYLESEHEFQALSADTENAAKLSDSQASLFQVSANIVEASVIPPLQTANGSDQSTTEKPESTEQSVSQEHYVESASYLNYGQSKLSTLVDTFLPEAGKSDESGVKKVPDEKSVDETKQRSRTLDPTSMSTWSDIRYDLRKRAATLSRSGSKRRPKLMPKPGVNDDYLFPDSVTPSKVDRELSVRSLSVGLPEGTYDVPYIDDDAFLPRKLRDPNNQIHDANESEYSSEGGDWNWSNSGVQNEVWNHAHIADVNECIPTPQLTPQQQRVPHKGKRANGKEYIDGKKPKTSRKRRLFNLCNCVGRQSRA